MSNQLARRIYLLDPRQYSQETIAVAFAKTSRSPQAFDQIAEELNDEKSAEFNEKWVVGYGHASVAEHAVLHLAIENVSRLAVECLESNRLASYTEKSSRYQRWDRKAYYTPPELEGHSLRAEYQHVCEQLFDLYLECQPYVQAQLRRERPIQSGEGDSSYQRRVISDSLDAARFLLPAASLANLGMTANARTLEYAIMKMLSSPLEEVRQTGTAIKETACRCAPTLIKYAAANEHLREMSELQTKDPTGSSTRKPVNDWLKLVNYNSLGAEKALAALLFRQGNRDYTEYFEMVSRLTLDEKKALLSSKLAGMGQHDCLPREFEHTSYTFDVILDQGAYYEIKRHRMMTQSPQALGAGLGYATPRIFKTAGLLDRYHQAMDAAADLWSRLAEWNPAVASYIVPNGFNRRVLLSMNIREAYTLIKLRSSPKAHFSVRRVAQRMAEEIRNAHPTLADLFLNNLKESSESLEKEFFC